MLTERDVFLSECSSPQNKCFRWVLLDGSPYGHRHWQNWECTWSTGRDIVLLSEAHDRLVSWKLANKGSADEPDTQTQVGAKENA